MAICLIARIRAAALLSVSVVALTACSDMEYVADRTQQGASDMYDSIFSSKKKPKTSPTKVEVSTPAAAPYEDVRAKEIAVGTKDANNSLAEPVELGAMRDNDPLLKQPGDAASDDMKPSSAQSVASDTPPSPQADMPIKPMPEPVNVATDKMGAPLMVIRFNQHHVYYDGALSKAITTAERAKPGIFYSVVSRLPDLSALPAEQRDNINSRAQDNLHNVVTQMQQLGVPANRIKIANQKQDVRSQEIAVYVN